MAGPGDFALGLRDRGDLFKIFTDSNSSVYEIDKFTAKICWANAACKSKCGWINVGESINAYLIQIDILVDRRHKSRFEWNNAAVPLISSYENNDQEVWITSLLIGESSDSYFFRADSWTSIIKSDTSRLTYLNLARVCLHLGRVEATNFVPQPPPASVNRSSDDVLRRTIKKIKRRVKKHDIKIKYMVYILIGIVTVTLTRSMK